jgi:hypothetical protein
MMKAYCDVIHFTSELFAAQGDKQGWLARAVRDNTGDCGSRNQASPGGFLSINLSIAKHSAFFLTDQSNALISAEHSYHSM